MYLFKRTLLTITTGRGGYSSFHRATRVCEQNGKSIMSIGCALGWPSGFNSPIVIPPFLQSSLRRILSTVFNFQKAEEDGQLWRQRDKDRRRKAKAGSPQTIKLEAHFWHVFCSTAIHRGFQNVIFFFQTINPWTEPYLFSHQHRILCRTCPSQRRQAFLSNSPCMTLYKT